MSCARKLLLELPPRRHFLQQFSLDPRRDPGIVAPLRGHRVTA